MEGAVFELEEGTKLVGDAAVVVPRAVDVEVDRQQSNEQNETQRDSPTFELGSVSRQPVSRTPAPSILRDLVICSRSVAENGVIRGSRFGWSSFRKTGFRGNRGWLKRGGSLQKYIVYNELREFWFVS